jgi:hypothetical protein
MERKMPNLKYPKYVVYHIPDAQRLDNEATLALMWNEMVDRGVNADILCLLYEDEEEDEMDQVVFNVYRAGATGPLVEHPEARTVLTALRKMMIYSGLVVQLNGMSDPYTLVSIIQRCLNVSFCEVNRHETIRTHVVVGDRIVAAMSLSIEI